MSGVAATSPPEPRISNLTWTKEVGVRLYFVPSLRMIEVDIILVMLISLNEFAITMVSLALVRSGEFPLR